MIRVLIVSRTKGGTDSVQVGGVDLATGQSYHMLGAGGRPLPASAPYGIGEIYEMELKKMSGVVAPHTENVEVTSFSQTGCREDVVAVAGQHDLIVTGDYSAPFRGMLRLAKSGSAFVDKTRIPDGSYAFWRPNVPLFHVDFQGKKRYTMLFPAGRISMPYVGWTADTPRRLEAGTLLRVMLGPWWKPDNSAVPEACYLRLCGWF